ncbi:MAG: hypothetical protein IPO77_10745 [Acidobacteria bacterium]|nr:hypothetical protein [Acidobacteriota bacterium]
MSINDPLIHPALIDPRLWGDAGLYETSINIDRSPVTGDEHHTAEKNSRSVISNSIFHSTATTRR